MLLLFPQSSFYTFKLFTAAIPITLKVIISVANIYKLLTSKLVVPWHTISAFHRKRKTWAGLNRLRIQLGAWSLEI